MKARAGAIVFIVGCWLVPHSMALQYVSSATFWNGSVINTDFGRGITIDGSGNIYVVGTINSTNDRDIWIGKYNSSLILQDYTTVNGSGNYDDEGNDVVIDGNGNIYVTRLPFLKRRSSRKK